MKKGTAVSTPPTEANNGVQDVKPETTVNEHVFTLNPNDVTSVICGNRILFVGRGAREVTLIAPVVENDEE